MQDKKEYQKVTDYLRSLIEQGELRTGSKLPTERELSERLGISRNSIREALRTLENTGVIESRHGSGNYISGNMEKSMSGIFDMMLLLRQTNQDEVCAFRRSLDKAVCLSLIDGNCGCDVIDSIEYTFENTEDPRAVEKLTEQDRLFHYSLIRATGNQLWICIAEAIMKIYRSWIDAVLKKADTQTILELSETHNMIIKAIKDQDRIECEKWIDRHYDIADRELKSENGK